MPNIIENNIMEFEAKCFLLKYTGSFAPADFSGAAFTCAHFQNIAKISSLCEFDYISEGNAFLVSNDLGAADLVHSDFC